jgi:putative protein-disulfide isomerase
MSSSTLTSTLHYIHDPLCGWCYAAAPLVEAAREVLPIVLHGGGLMTGTRRQRVTAELRAYVMPHDQRIAELSGQPFGEAYTEGLLRDTEALFDSEPPINALLAADELQGQGLDLLARIQTAHYVEGRRVAEAAVLTELAAEIGLRTDAFAAAFQRLQGEATQAHIAASRALLARAGGGGFPTFLLEREGRFERLDAQAWYGRPAAWQQWLRELNGAAPAAH